MGDIEACFHADRNEPVKMGEERWGLTGGAKFLRRNRKEELKPKCRVDLRNFFLLWRKEARIQETLQAGGCDSGEMR